MTRTQGDEPRRKQTPVSRPSLRRRLMLSVFVVLVVFFGLTVFLLDMLFRRAAERSLREVHRCADGGARRRGGSGRSRIGHADRRARYALRDAGLRAVCRNPFGQWRERSGVRNPPPAPQCNSARRSDGGGRSFFCTEIAGTDIRLAVASRGIVWDDLHGQPARFTFSVASSLEAYERAASSAFRQQLIGWFVGLALLFVATLALLLRWLLNPMRRLEREIQRSRSGCARATR